LEEQFNSIAWSVAIVEPETEAPVNTTKEPVANPRPKLPSTPALVAMTLEHNKQEARLAAVKALTEVAKRGDPKAITAILACLKDSDTDVRLAAVEALMQLSEFGNQQVVAPASVQISAVDLNIRSAVMYALAEAAKHHSRHTNTAASSYRKDAGIVSTTKEGTLPMDVLAPTIDKRAQEMPLMV